MPCHIAPWKSTTPATAPTPMAAISPAVIVTVEFALGADALGIGMGGFGAVTLCACATPAQAIEANRIKPSRRFSMGWSLFQIIGSANDDVADEATEDPADDCRCCESGTPG